MFTSLQQEARWPRAEQQQEQKLEAAETKLISILSGVNQRSIKNEVNKLEGRELGY